MEVAPDYGLLPKSRTFGDSLPAFLFPYLAYIALASLPHRFLPAAAAEALRFAVVGGLMLAFRRAYSLGPRFTARQAAAALTVALAALVLWILLYRMALALPLPAFRDRLALAAVSDPGPAYACLRTLNSALLVPFFEELFCRAYVAELLVGMPAGKGDASAQGLSARSFSGRLGLRMDDHPVPLAEPPARGRAFRGSALVFMLGHAAAAWPAALAYFTLTNVLYRRTRSFRACVLAHALVNLGVAALVQAWPEMRFLWY